jgi:hypothetical protein
MATLAGLATVVLTYTARAQSGFGAVQTTDVTGARTNVNEYPSLADVYLNGGGAGSGNILDPGCYAYAITNTSESTLVTTIGDFYRTLAQGNVDKAFFNILSGVPSPFAPLTEQGGSGTTVINAPTPNGEYKLVVWQLLAGDPGPGGINCPTTPTTLDALRQFGKKSDNFRINATTTGTVPEPASAGLLAVGVLPVLGMLRRRK